MKLIAKLLERLHASASKTIDVDAPLTASADGDTDAPIVWFGASSGAVELQAAAEGEAGDKLPTFKGTAYTGGTMRPMHFYRDVVVDLAGAKVAPGSRPVHRDHRTDQIVGHAESGAIEIGAKRITISGVISGTGEAAREVRDNGRNKFPWQLSIGARIEKIELIEANTVITVNGRKFKSAQEFYVVRACTIYEVSFVSLGGDDKTSAIVAASFEDGSAMKFTQWLAARGKSIDSLTATEFGTLRSQYQTEHGSEPTNPQAPAADVTASGTDASPAAPMGGADTITAGAGYTAPPPTPDQLQAQAAQREREANEREAARLELTAAREDICARFGNPSIKVDGNDVPLLVHATRQGWDANTTELHARRNSRPEGVTTYTPNHDLNAKGFEAAMCLNAGCTTDDLAGDYDERALNAAASKEYRNAGLKQLFATAALRAGCSQAPGVFDGDTILAALEAERDLRASASTFSVSGVLSNVMNKRMQSVYKSIMDVLSRIVDWGPVSDFKDTYSYQLTVSGDWAKVGKNGQLEHGSLVESQYSNKAETRGMMIGLTRQHIRNDDLRAFLRIPTGIARKSANKKQEIGFGVLLSMVADNDFSVGNGNYISGATSALGIQGLQLGVNKFKTLKDEAGEYISVRPAILLTGTTLSVTAQDLHVKTNIDTVLDSSGKSQIVHNPHANKYEPHDSPYLDSDHGGTDTGWWLLADKDDVPVLDGVALDGRHVPYVQRGEPNFDTLGLQWRAFDDWGIGKGNSKGGVHSKGAA
ncbi:hypothetical protein U8335_04025 [Roseiconus lacunae]|uniref:phage major capsid protein n=1 Tax=Roseiconus lacunae TaxID=2605694 RepID=UPI0030931AC3|nr:hypothetical protein U8335_04025 [Stieleria sp. HD01]